MNTNRKLQKSEENLAKLCHKLDYLFEFLHNVYSINSGGCCYVASVLAELFEKDDIDYSVIVYDCEYAEFYDIDCSQYHYTLCVEDYILNCQDFEEVDYAEYIDVDAEDLLNHYKECDDWNSLYDTYRNKYIKKLITNFYKDFTYDLREKQPTDNSK